MRYTFEAYVPLTKADMFPGRKWEAPRQYHVTCELSGKLNLEKAQEKAKKYLLPDYELGELKSIEE